VPPLKKNLDLRIKKFNFDELSNNGDVSSRTRKEEPTESTRKLRPNSIMNSSQMLPSPISSLIQAPSSPALSKNSGLTARSHVPTSSTPAGPSSGNIKVICRFRPLNEKEKTMSQNLCVEFSDPQTCVVKSLVSLSKKRLKIILTNSISTGSLTVIAFNRKSMRLQQCQSFKVINEL
jgi:hypothetical protein